LKTTPTEPYTLRTLPEQIGHSLAAGSVNDWTSSNRLPHSAFVQAYW
jgi:hypothetical protein